MTDKEREQGASYERLCTTNEKAWSTRRRRWLRRRVPRETMEMESTGRGKMKGQVREDEAIRNPLPNNQNLQRTRMGEPPTKKANGTHHGEKGNRREHPKDEKREGWGKEDGKGEVDREEKSVATAKK